MGYPDANLGESGEADPLSRTTKEALLLAQIQRRQTYESFDVDDTLVEVTTKQNRASCGI